MQNDIEGTILAPSEYLSVLSPNMISAGTEPLYTCILKVHVRFNHGIIHFCPFVTLDVSFFGWHTIYSNSEIFFHLLAHVTPRSAQVVAQMSLVSICTVPLPKCPSNCAFHRTKTNLHTGQGAACIYV